MIKRNFWLGATLAASILISACGGGGSSSTTTTTTAPLATDQVKAVALSANSADWGLGAAYTSMSYGWSYLAYDFPKGTGTNTTASGVSVCTSGTYTATWSIAYAAGDNITLNYNNCVKSDSRTYNGSETHRITSVTNGGNNILMSSQLSGLNITTLAGTKISFTSDSLIRAASYTSGTYPIKYTATGSINVTLQTTSSNITNGTYAVTNASVIWTYPNSSSSTLSTSHTSGNGTYQDVQTAAKTLSAYTSIVRTTYPVYSVKYKSADITVTNNSGSSTTLTGTNSDGSSISAINVATSYF